MSEEKPQEPILAWFATTLTPILGGGWQYHVRKAIGLNAGELRPLLESDLDEEHIEGAECLVSQYLRERAVKLQQQADKAAAVATAFEAAAHKRRFDAWRAGRDAHLSECDAIVQEMYDWHVYVGDIVEAA